MSTTKQEASDPSKRSARSSIRPLFKTFVTAQIVFAVVLLSLPVSASAGFFSFLTSAVGRVFAESDGDASLTSQNLPLLRAPLTADLETAIGGGDITIVDESALLSAVGPAGTLADIEARPTSDRISVYVVREGDTLSQIAQMFGVSTNTIVWANDITRGDRIAPGQTLVILPISGVQHTVVKGDTLRSIAKKYKGDLDEIVSYNGIAPDATLNVGSVVVVPDGEVAAPARTYAPTSVVRGTSGPSYAGYYLRPIQGGVKTQGAHGFNGVDLASYHGAPIFAAADGTVIISRSGGWNGGYGNYVVVRHDNGTQTLYAHNASNIVGVGQSVVQGQVIAYMGSTGRSTGTHLHFEIRGARNPF